MEEHLLGFWYEIWIFDQIKNLQKSKINIAQSVDNKKMTDSNLKCNDDKQINLQTTKCELCLCSSKGFHILSSFSRKYTRTIGKIA